MPGGDKTLFSNNKTNFLFGFGGGKGEKLKLKYSEFHCEENTHLTVDQMEITCRSKNSAPNQMINDSLNSK